jgi:glycerol-3-phosphate acyltransferase PlsY
MSAELILVFFVSYLLGSVPFGILITRLFGHGDLREMGSGNIGATNVLRTGDKRAAVLTLLCDAGKGFLAVIIARELWGEPAALIAAIGAFVGHIFPVWLGFNGGKGVATFLGIILALNVLAGLCTCFTWLAIAVMSRISSAAALIAAMSAPFWLYSFGQEVAAVIIAGLAALVWLRHRANIARLVAGKEPRIGRK